MESEAMTTGVINGDPEAGGGSQPGISDVHTQ